MRKVLELVFFALGFYFLIICTWYHAWSNVLATLALCSFAYASIVNMNLENTVIIRRRRVARKKSKT